MQPLCQSAGAFGRFARKCRAGLRFALAAADCAARMYHSPPYKNPEKLSIWPQNF